jgi:hypothetical protein
MAIETRQFREPKGLNVFADLRRTEVFPEMRRVPESWSAAAERRALLGLAPRTPEWIGPDHLTPLGLVGQIGAGFCYVLARSNQGNCFRAMDFMPITWSIPSGLSP